MARVSGSRERGVWRWGLFLLVPVLIGLGLAGCATTAPVARQPPEIGSDLRCPVCGGHPAEQPRHQCQILLADGQQIAFDCGQDMFSYLQLMDQFGYAKKQGVGKGLAEIWVRDYPSGLWLDGRTAWYVAGSGVRGPTGKAIIPFAERGGAEDFRRQHAGKAVTFPQVNGELLKTLKE